METKTDRELFELAAKSVGYWSDEFNCVSDLPHLNWNPLLDDGDALRLAVILKITLHIDESLTDAETKNGYFTEAHLSDACAATRRAIVRAAARIGESK